MAVVRSRWGGALHFGACASSDGRQIILSLLAFVLAADRAATAQQITAAGQPAQLDVRVAGDESIRVTLKPVSFKDDFPLNPALAERKYASPALSLREVTRPQQRKVGNLTVEVRPTPLTLVVRNASGQLIQEVVFADDGTLSFRLDEHPVLGMGEGGPRPQKGPSTGRDRARTGANTPCSSTAAERSTPWSRAGRATCTGRAIPSRCCSAPGAGACSSRPRGARSTCATRTAACSCR